MNDSTLLSLAQNAIMVTLILVAPALLVSLIIGSVVSFFQAATQINEVTLTFVPKLLAVILILVLLGSWMSQHLLTFTTNLFSSLPEMIH
ncbi:MAG: flagellar biosynthesis protein FliQ [Anaerolineales bacterium]|jgi:flagellar biosynthetic protein FliQ|nr:flagellar biosynthesis protein FliQ [Anaerolineales bacterium]